MPTVTQAIGRFLELEHPNHPAPELLGLWSPEMETQVMVSNRGGEPVDGRPGCWSDGTYTWHNIRIPKRAKDNPEWVDYQMRWPIENYVQAIGLTGWNWVQRTSPVLGFDFDSIKGHAKGVGISNEQLEAVMRQACELPYFEVRRSTRGEGIHLRAYTEGFTTENHTIHAALARAVLAKAGTECNFPFHSHVDACGQNLWIWHQAASKEKGSFELIKPAELVIKPEHLPSNWRDHEDVVARRRTTVRVRGLDAKDEDEFGKLVNSRTHTPLDDSHKAIIDALADLQYTTIWDADHHLLKTHTCAIRELFQAGTVRLVGGFETNSQGNDPGQPNCFMIPVERGAFKVVRFSPGITEHESWNQDGQGWTYTFVNRLPSLRTASTLAGATEVPDNGGFEFATLKDAAKTLALLGDPIEVPDAFAYRPATLKRNRDGRVLVLVKKEEDDQKQHGWVLYRKSHWTQVTGAQADLPAQESDDSWQDEFLRALVSPNNALAGWTIRDLTSDGSWRIGRKDDAKSALLGLSYTKNEADYIIGKAIVRPWKLVNMPFQPEYPGGRIWNRDAAQFAFEPVEVEEGEPQKHPTWDRMLTHLGDDLTEAVRELAWCEEANIRDGKDYLIHWIACLFRDVYAPLPYLFFWGPQDCGKTMIVDAIRMLMRNGHKYVADGKRVLDPKVLHNDELENAILCYVDEMDLSGEGKIYNRLKEYVTNKYISIRKMRTGAYEQVNTTHWIHTANDRGYCPTFRNDTRITVVHVKELTEKIPPQIFRQRLEEEAPAFLRTIMDLELPRVQDRLRIPVIVTKSKQEMEKFNRNALEVFVEDYCHEVPGYLTPYSEFKEAFEKFLDPQERSKWTPHKLKAAMPERFPIGRRTNNETFVANLALIKPEQQPTNAGRFISREDGYLVPEQHQHGDGAMHSASS